MANHICLAAEDYFYTRKIKNKIKKKEKKSEKSKMSKSWEEEDCVCTYRLRCDFQSLILTPGRRFIISFFLHNDGDLRYEISSYTLKLFISSSSPPIIFQELKLHSFE